MSIFGRRLKDLRDKTGETQDNIGKILGKSGGAVSKYEVGEREPELSDIALLAKHFNTTTDYMLGLSHSLYNPYNVAQNIHDLMGSLSAKEFSNALKEKTGYLITASELEDYIRLRTLPPQNVLEALAKYANVEVKAFYQASNPNKNINSHTDLEALMSYVDNKDFKRAVRISEKILRNELDLTTIEKMIDNMIEFKNNLLSPTKNKSTFRRK